MSKIFALAGVVIKELYRRKDFYVLFVLTALLTLTAGAVNFFHEEKIIRYVKDICLLLIWVSALVISIVTTARQIPAEREARTLFPLLAKPVSQGQVIAGKFLGCWLATGVALLVFYFFFAIITGSRENIWPVVIYLQAAWMQWCLLAIVIAMVLLGSIYFAAPSSTSTISFVVVGGGLLLGSHLKVLALQQPEPMQTVLTYAYFLIPHLEWYDLRDFMVYDLNAISWPALALATLYAAAWTGILLLLAWIGFRRKKSDDVMKTSPLLLLVALLALAFTLATGLASKAENWSQRKKSDNLFGMMFGDGRKLFANHFFTMADVYFHSGYYPSVFDKNAAEQKEIISASHGRKETEEDEKKEDFFGQPKDWIDSFGRNFRIAQHMHLENGNEREILPWLRLAAELDPQKIETYTVGAYFLREHLNRADQAELFLREGLRNNPDSCEILLELGRLYRESTRDLERARHVWELGLKKYAALKPEEQKEFKMVDEAILVNLARLEDETGNFHAAISYFKAAQALSPEPQALQVHIDAIENKRAAPLLSTPPKL